MNGCVVERLRLYVQLARLDKPIGILLLLWPTLWGLWWAAGGWPSFKLIVIFVLGTVLMRSAGCVINDYADRDFDRHVERTVNRPLTSGKVTTREALLLALALTLMAAFLLLFLNPLSVKLSLVAAILAGSYPFFKRFFAIPQAYLGIAFGFGIPMAYAAHLDMIPQTAWVLLLANVFWAMAYDTEYAMVDRADDLKIGIKTSAITLGRFDVAGIVAFYLLFLSIWAVALAPYALGAIFYIALAGALAQAVWHFTLIRTRTREGCFTAFRVNHWLGATVFAGIAGSYLLRQVLSN